MTRPSGAGRSAARAGQRPAAHQAQRRHAKPLQHTGPDRSPDPLPTVPAFAAALAGWPEAGGFDAGQDAERFITAGPPLVSHLQQDLGPSY